SYRNCYVASMWQVAADRQFFLETLDKPIPPAACIVATFAGFARFRHYFRHLETRLLRFRTRFRSAFFNRLRN
ncbi:MAG: hypothetical protein ABIO63_12545, partial [Casimicrobiaceae bacterium]